MQHNLSGSNPQY